MRKGITTSISFTKSPRTAQQLRELATLHGESMNAIIMRLIAEEWARIKSETSAHERDSPD
jgi:hypothetical protein